MTLQEILDKLCLEKHNHYWTVRFRRSVQEREDIMMEAAELYGKEKWSEACYEQQKLLTEETLKRASDLPKDIVRMAEHMKAKPFPIPEFKP